MIDEYWISDTLLLTKPGLTELFSRKNTSLRFLQDYNHMRCSRKTKN
jgi:hypothetical protein